MFLSTAPPNFCEAFFVVFFLLLGLFFLSFARYPFNDLLNCTFYFYFSHFVCCLPPFLSRYPSLLKVLIHSLTYQEYNM